MTWALHLGDCLDRLRSMADASVDHVITDPPYEAEAHNLQRRKKGTRVDGTGAWQRRGGQTVQAPINFDPMSEALRRAVGAEIARIARRWVLVFCQSEAAMLWRAALSPLRYKRTAIWVKPDGMPQLTGDRPGMGYESIVCAHRKGRSVWNGGGRCGVFTHLCKDQGGGAGVRNDHPTTKPIRLMLELLELFTDPGETILDPFAGSGTTGVAALRLGRSFIGCEKDAGYYETARQRLAAEEANSTLQAARAGQLPLLGARNA